MDYCYYFFEDDTEPCLELDHYFVQCGFGQLSSTAHDVLEDGVKNGRDGKGMILIFAAGNEFRKGDDVNYEGYDLGVPRCCGAFTPSTRVVSRRGCRGWSLFRF